MVRFLVWACAQNEGGLTQFDKFMKNKILPILSGNEIENKKKALALNKNIKLMIKFNQPYSILFFSTMTRISTFTPKMCIDLFIKGMNLPITSVRLHKLYV